MWKGLLMVNIIISIHSLQEDILDIIILANMEMQESDRLDMLLHNIDQQESEESSSAAAVTASARWTLVVLPTRRQ